VRRNATTAISVVLIALGLVAIARTVADGVGGGLGLLLGAMLVAAGALRLYLARRSSSGSLPGEPRRAPKRRGS